VRQTCRRVLPIVNRVSRSTLTAAGRTLRTSSAATNLLSHVKSSGFCEIGPMPACSSEQGGSQRRGGASAPQTTGEIKMTVKTIELKTLMREEWLAMDKQTLEDQLEMLDKEYPLVLHTDAGRTFSTVRRMKTEKTMGLPINLRTGFAISVETGKAANAMTEDEWEEFYYALSERLNRDYPHLYKSYFHPMKTEKEYSTPLS
jgi:hypothetical protein